MNPDGNTVTRRQATASASAADDDAAAEIVGAGASSRRSPHAARQLEETVDELRGRFGRLGRVGACIVGLSLVMSFLFYWHLARYVLVTPHSQDVYFLKMETCPACYGNDFCDHFTNSEVTFTGIYQYPIAHRLLASTRVFQGKKGLYKGHPIIIKSLATPQQFDTVQRLLCQYSNMQDTKRCSMRDALWKRLPLGEDTLTLYDLKGADDMFRCPSQRLVDLVKDAYRLRDPDKPKRLLRNEEMSLLFTAMVNPEPLMLMTFTSQNGWPFPVYHGACGRFIVVEHRGAPASELLTAKLSDRLLVSKRILELSIRLTSSDTGFAVYPNDWDLSNFAVYPDTRTVTLVDLSNVTVVDTKQFRDDDATAEQNHVTKELYSDADTTAVCQHKKSDWNLLAACHMLRRTLLADQASDSLIGSEIDQCASSEPKEPRLQLVRSIITAIDKQL